MALDALVKAVVAFSSLMAWASAALDMGKVVFVINSQPHPVHAAAASERRDDLVSDLRAMGVGYPRVFLAHRNQEVPFHGAWTYLPTLEHLARETGRNKIVEAEWFVFLEETTGVNPKVLRDVLSERDSNKEVYTVQGGAKETPPPLPWFRRLSRLLLITVTN